MAPRSDLIINGQRFVSAPVVTAIIPAAKDVQTFLDQCRRRGFRRVKAYDDVRAIQSRRYYLESDVLRLAQDLQKTEAPKPPDRRSPLYPPISPAEKRAQVYLGLHHNQVHLADGRRAVSLSVIAELIGYPALTIRAWLQQPDQMPLVSKLVRLTDFPRLSGLISLQSAANFVRAFRAQTRRQPKQRQAK
ncbi:MAG: hypothetical protein HY092_01955 [Candidatus Kerfeldbacteria bacterium]|nr:hypothetical protein [Candidatus Kerfeldbacteria bacterium]